MIEFTVKGSFANTEAYLARMKRADFFKALQRFGEQGRAALASATPMDTGLTAQSWNYRIEGRGTYTSIIWYNTHVVSGVPIAIILQYGHGTGTGGYVAGRDYINPAIRPVFEKISAELDREVRK